MTPDNSAEARAREMLAATCERRGYSREAREVREGYTSFGVSIGTAIAAMLTFSAEQNTGGMPGRDVAGLDAGLVKRLRDRLAMATQGEWQLQDGCSWRRIGTHFHDGNVLCPTNHPRDNHPDLIAGKGKLYANLTLIVEAVNALPALLGAADVILAGTGGTGAEAMQERCAVLAEKWRDENKAKAAQARKRESRADALGLDHPGMADMLDGAAIECNAIATAIRSLPTTPGEQS